MRITSKGQVTIPADIREKAGLLPETEVEIVMRGDTVILRKAEKSGRRGKRLVALMRAGGVRRSPLPDFYIGAHAAIRGYLLLTRDATRYRNYFPRLDLVSP